MIFASLSFAVFLPIVFIIYWAIPHKFRWIFLLGANYYFYMSGSPKYVLLLFTSTLVTYACGLMMERADTGRKKLWIWIGILSTLGSLFFFKYFAFTMETIASIAQAISLPMDDFTLNIIMPLGISFYTFKAVGYVIDVYRGKQKAETHFGYYATFISYFPDVLSGPIDRADVLLPQLKSEKCFHYQEGVYALRLMLLGFAKKILVADLLTRYVDVIFNEVTRYNGFTLVLASLLYTIQIYCDFSGYSDIAMGTSELLGIKLMPNFKNPYFAKSIKEFWSRWHISLSSWFRDYVYIPLGGNRVSKARRAMNLMITFLVSGIWHGADYTFIIWGALHGFYQVAENWIKDVFRKKNDSGITEKSATNSTITAHTNTSFGSRVYNALKGTLQTALTFCLVSFAWIFFRSNGLRGAFYFITNMFADFSITKARMDMGIVTADLWMIVIVIPF